jgi:hypothetical protein
MPSAEHDWDRAGFRGHLILTPPPKGTSDAKQLERDDGFLTASEIAALAICEPGLNPKVTLRSGLLDGSVMGKSSGSHPPAGWFAHAFTPSLRRLRPGSGQ